MQVPVILGTSHPHIPLHLLGTVASHVKELQSAGPSWAFTPASPTVKLFLSGIYSEQELNYLS